MTVEEAYLKEYGAPPDEEITPAMWAWVHAQYRCPTSIRAFYTFAALVETRHQKELAELRARLTPTP